MIVGFTGTRKGMSIKQLSTFLHLMEAKSSGWTDPQPVLHHGDCVGADQQADGIATQLGWYVVVHPPLDRRYRAYCQNPIMCGEVLPQKEYIARNHDIVDACEFVVAAPRGPETTRSGTWATIRYAKSIGKHVIILDRDMN